MMIFSDTAHRILQLSIRPYLDEGEELICCLPASEGPAEKRIDFITSVKGWSLLYKLHLLGLTDRRLVVLRLGRSWAVRGSPTSLPRTDVTVSARRAVTGWIYLELNFRSGETRRLYVDSSWEVEANRLIQALGGTL